MNEGALNEAIRSREGTDQDQDTEFQLSPKKVAASPIKSLNKGIRYYYFDIKAVGKKIKRGRGRFLGGKSRFEKMGMGKNIKL